MPFYTQLSNLANYFTSFISSPAEQAVAQLDNMCPLAPEFFTQEVCSVFEQASETIIEETTANAPSLYDTLYSTGQTALNAVYNTFAFASNTLQAANSASATTANLANTTNTLTKSLEQLVLMTDTIGQTLLLTIMSAGPETLQTRINKAACVSYSENKECEQYESGTGIACLVTSAYLILTLRDVLKAMRKTKNQAEFEELIRQGHEAFKIQSDPSLMNRIFGKAQHAAISMIMMSVGIHFALPTAAILGMTSLPFIAPVALFIKSKVFDSSSDHKAQDILTTVKALGELQTIQARYQHQKDLEKVTALLIEESIGDFDRLARLQANLANPTTSSTTSLSLTPAAEAELRKAPRGVVANESSGPEDPLPAIPQDSSRCRRSNKRASKRPA